VPVGTGVERVATVVRMDEVDPAGDRQHSGHHFLQFDAARVGMAGVKAEAHPGWTNGIPQPVEPVEPAGHRVLATSGVLDEHRQLVIQHLGTLAPVVDPELGIVGLEYMSTMDDQCLGADLGRSVDMLLQQRAARDANPVVRRSDIEPVGRMNVQIDAPILRRGAEGYWTALVGDYWWFPALRIAEEELGEVGFSRLGLRERVTLFDMGADPDCRHRSTLPRDVKIAPSRCLTRPYLRAPLHSGFVVPLDRRAARREGAAVGRTPVDARGEDRAVEFPSAPSSVPAARHLVRDDLMARNLPSRVIDDSMLVVSELITNAVSHAQPLRVAGHAGSVRLRWTADPPRVWIGVTDGGGRDQPHVESPDPADVSGRGLAIVQALAIDWGVTRVGPEVTVYAVVTG
jgi:serine/threonine-protein kinase RsbW